MRIAKGLIIIGLCLIMASGIAIAGDKKLKAGFIYVGPVGDYGWSHAHDIGRKFAESKLPWLESVYIELLERVACYSRNPETRVVSHNYDFCQPSPEGYELFDIFPIGESWIYPYLDQKGFTDPLEQREVIRFMLTRFGERLERVRRSYPDRFFMADTQGTLNEKQWRNEIHPTPAGFRVLSRIVHREIQRALAAG